MSMYMFLLTVLSIVIIVFSLGYTFAVAKVQRDLKGEFDTAIPEKVQGNIYTRNPVFLTYVLWFVLLLLIIISCVLYW